MKKQIVGGFSVILAGVGLFLPTGCSEEKATNQPTGQVVISQSKEALLAAAVSGHEAILDIVGVRTGIDMTVNDDGSVTVTVSGIPVGNHTFQINYRASGVRIFQASGQATVVENTQVTANLTATTANFDDDGDGVTNITEVQAGTNPLDPSSKPSKPTQLAAGDAHSCARIANGTVQCWGANPNGELGDGTTTTSFSPVVVTGINTAASVTTGSSHNCAVLTDKTVRCWGRNTLAQLGDGTTSATRLTPVAVLGINTAVSVAAGADHTCALLTDSTVRCWGLNSSGQLVYNTSEIHQSPVAPAITIIVGLLSAGNDHTCAGGFNAIRCWGDNESGQLGNGTFIDSLVPASAVSGLNNIQSMASGYGHNCAIKSDATVQCWGANNSRQLADGTNVTRNTAVPTVGLLTAVTSVSGGRNHTCGRLDDGTVACWGDNFLGKLGDGTTLTRFAPVTVSGISTAVSVAVGSAHSCALLSNNSVRCWGANLSGQLGNGSNRHSSTPVQVIGLQ